MCECTTDCLRKKNYLAFGGKQEIGFIIHPVRGLKTGVWCNSGHVIPINDPSF